MGWEALSHKDMETLRSLATGQGAWRSAHVPARYATCLPYINPSKEDMEELLLDDLRRFIKDEMASKFLENRLDYFFSILGLGQQIFFKLGLQFAGSSCTTNVMVWLEVLARHLGSTVPAAARLCSSRRDFD